MSSEPNAKKPRVEISPPCSSTPTTLCIRHPRLRTEFQLINWFLFDHREELGISSWFGIEEVSTKNVAETEKEEKQLKIVEQGNLKDPSRIACVYVSFSRNPYFLIEFPGSPDELLKKLVGLDGVLFKDIAIKIMVALPGTSVETQRLKVEKVGEKHIETEQKKEDKKTPRPSTPQIKPKFTPRILKKN